MTGLHKKFPKIITKEALENMTGPQDLTELLQKSDVKQGLEKESM